jgi:hypothetical protein
MCTALRWVGDDGAGSGEGVISDLNLGQTVGVAQLLLWCSKPNCLVLPVDMILLKPQVQAACTQMLRNSSYCFWSSDARLSHSSLSLSRTPPLYANPSPCSRCPMLTGWLRRSRALLTVGC